jgi:hypothetical protein
MKHQIDGRKAWLEENIISASAFLATMTVAESKRPLDPREIDMRQLCLAFMYLYNVVQDQELLDEVESFFPNETIH